MNSQMEAGSMDNRGKSVAVLKVSCAMLLGGLVVSIAACGGSPSGSGEVSSEHGAGATIAQAAESDGGGQVIARYAGKTFTADDFRNQVERLNVRSRKALNDPDRRAQFVENYILSELIFDKGKKQGLDKDADIQRQVQDLERRLVIQRVMQDYQSAPVSDDEVRAYYDQHPDEFRSDTVHAAHILVKDEALAKQIHDELVADPSKFAELAEKNSIDKSNAKKGGDLGSFGRGRMVKEFEDAAFGLTKDGQISDVVQTRFGYHIIKRLGREDGGLKPFDEVKNQIRVRLVNDKRRKKTEEFLAKLKADSGYQLDKDALASLQIPGVDKASSK
jgi:peptidyl-prolyl cis-trans isomerase C